MADHATHTQALLNQQMLVTPSPSPERSLCKVMLKTGIWVVGIPSWIYGITDRGMTAIADGYLSAMEIVQLLVASILFLSWLLLKPDNSSSGSGFTALQRYGKTEQLSSEPPSLPAPSSSHSQLSLLQQRAQELGQKYVASQTHILPFPYLCQIYHLLNLKHLESIHGFSLGNLKVIGVSHFQPTHQGGSLKFQTVLDSPFNILRIWRQPVVEVELTLHTPYLVELKIPAYQGKEITIIFNVVPLGQDVHQFVIDIYSDVEWPKSILRFIFQLAASLTLLEDLPYLRHLSTRNLRHSFEQTIPRHQTMQLFRRFIELYGSSFEVPQLLDIKSIQPVNQQFADI